MRQSDVCLVNLFALKFPLQNHVDNSTVLGTLYPMMKGIWNIADDIVKIPYIANIFKIIFSKPTD